MRRIAKKLKPTVPASEIRARYKWLKTTLIGLIWVWGIGWLLGFFFLPDQLVFFIAIPLFSLYLLFCHAFGRLANCFGESTASWALSAVVFNVFVLALGFFAFKDEVIKAHREND